MPRCTKVPDTSFPTPIILLRACNNISHAPPSARSHGFRCARNSLGVVPVQRLNARKNAIETHEAGRRHLTKLTATCAEHDADEVHEVFARALDSVRFAGPPAHTPPPPSWPASAVRPAVTLPEVPMPGSHRRR